MAAYFVKFEFVINPKRVCTDSAIINYERGERITEESFIKKIQEKRGMNQRILIQDITKL